VDSIEPLPGADSTANIDAALPTHGGHGAVSVHVGVAVHVGVGMW